MRVVPEQRHEEQPPSPDEPSPIRGISRNVWVLSLVSLCTDVSSELIYPLVPLFLTSVLGAPATVLGVIEGVAEATANVLKLVSGRVTDRHGRPRAWVFAGYGLSTLGKPLLALATVWPLVLLARVVDRIGKGTRTTPRDALIAASSDPATRGRSFGFHRGMDTLGAVIGPLAGVGLLAVTAQNFRLVFLLATLPALIGVSLIGRVHEPARRPGPPSPTGPVAAAFTYRTPRAPTAPSSASVCSSRSAIPQTPSSSSARTTWAWALWRRSWPTPSITWSTRRRAGRPVSCPTGSGGVASSVRGS